MHICILYNAHAPFPWQQLAIAYSDCCHGNNALNETKVKERKSPFFKSLNLSGYYSEICKSNVLILLMSMSVEGQFFLSFTGSIEHAEFYDVDNAYCKYGFHFGPEWNVVAGIEEGLTQMCKSSNDPKNIIVWNFPLDITFKSTNPHGWPQLIMSIYGLDLFGHDVIRGYGVCHLPLKTGYHEKRVSIYVPESSSTLQHFVAWLTGRRPELIDPAMLASGDGRELTRMRVEGTVTVTFNVVLKDLFKLGYDNGERRKK